jgi:hypothetical protein
MMTRELVGLLVSKAEAQPGIINWNRMDCIVENALVSATPPKDVMNMLLVRFQIQTNKTHIDWLVGAEACMCCPYPQTVTKRNNEMYIINIRDNCALHHIPLHPMKGAT